MNNYNHPDKFVNRHIGPNDKEIEKMLKVTGAGSLDELMDRTIPSNIRLDRELDLGEPVSEHELIAELREIASHNTIFRSYIGMGYYNTYTPAVIQRNILENPGWYTQYTPYQAEISQGRLEALINFQTMVIDMTGLPVANASLLDEGTSAAEAMHVAFASKKKNANKFFIDINCFPQTIDVIRTRALPLGIELVIEDISKFEPAEDYFGLMVQCPNDRGEIFDHTEIFNKAKEQKIACIAAADILSLALIKSPGEMGADIAVGSTQRFGVPMGYGGPHAAYFACKDEYRRIIPGRIIGVSVDSNNDKAYRMALQTREQHIRREKATSNICTAQVLLAIMAGFYAVYHGPEGIKAIAKRIHKLTVILDSSLKKLGFKQLNKTYFDTILIEAEADRIKLMMEDNNINLRYIDEKYIGISLDETVSYEDIKTLIKLFAKASGKSEKLNEIASNGVDDSYPEQINRKSEYLTHPVFSSYHSETMMLRYIKQLENKDLSLTLSMIPLGSCTMKLNAASEMYPISFPEFSSLHPFAPAWQAKGYHEIFRLLTEQLAKITEFSAVSLMPNSGAQGEFTGLMVIRAYHHSRGEKNRNVVLIPASAHGTNPASAVMAGMNVIVVKTTEHGEIDVEDLKLKAEKYKDNLAAIMVTYPSTHGVFEDSIVEICDIIHKYGGQVYMDGANLNAQVGLTSPGVIGADVCHINLHKTFCIPHGGGGPGMGPIAVAEHLAEFLPSHPVVKVGGDKGIYAVSAAPWGSANILMISYAYIRMMGIAGLKKATQMAILNANYVKARLEKHYPVLYSGNNDRVAHELIFDVRHFKHDYDIEVDDIAKRLMDYGFHAPTVSFPVPGTLMFEPTESESLYELDRFCTAMEMIYNEIMEIAEGKADRKNNVLKNAPHNPKVIASEKWEHPYSREKAAYPAPWLKNYKFWPHVGRVDNAYGDRNFMCSCIPISSYESVPLDEWPETVK